MNIPVKKIVIVGGGSAGWLTAGIIAADHVVNKEMGIEVILIESPDIPTVGVGEGTWPSMRATLKKIGISETQFIRECDASFKQGSKFINWSKGNNEFYYHPFTLPDNYSEINLAEYWLPHKSKISFSDAVCPQRSIADRYLAPKQMATPEYACVVNYGYHLDAGKFAIMLKKHCIDVLGVTYISDNVIQVNSSDAGDIASLGTQGNNDISGDLFIDCTGFASLLLGQHYKIPFKDQRGVLFNDSALAVQVPYANPEGNIESCTHSTATESGWIWDIGLPTRRGVGHVFSSAYTTEEQAEQTLRKYLEPSVGKAAAKNVSPRKLTFNPGYREKFWHKNCVAIGIAAGFIEPLEATALVLIELSAQMISEQLPANRKVMNIIAARFNDKLAHHWKKIIEFLKLHYVLTQRTDSQYWRDHCNPNTVPESLKELLTLWKYQTPWTHDTIRVGEMFPSASFQYVLFGMGAPNHYGEFNRRNNQKNVEMARGLFDENAKRTQHLVNGLPSNRELLMRLREYSFPKI
ncbi:MAG TPA: tryptophan 7-halogenase [Cellvibrio sp.]|nr:tryptophan 7-halogenase [Cellvibrio sp.]